MANNSDYNIGGIGPNSNATQGYFQYLVADEILVDNEIYANKVNVDNNILIKGRAKASEVELVTFVDDGFDDSSQTSFNPPKLLSTLFDDVNSLSTRVSNLESAGFTSTIDLSGIEGRITNLENIELPPVDLSNIETRLDALESLDFTPTDVSSLTTGLASLQTRTGTLESLIGLLNNNNPTDTVLENRIHNLESKINALISVYQSIKAIHNMPINLS